MGLFDNLLCALILVALFLGYQWGRTRDERRRDRERRKIWEREQAKLPKAIRKS